MNTWRSLWPSDQPLTTLRIHNTPSPASLSIMWKISKWTMRWQTERWMRLGRRFQLLYLCYCHICTYCIYTHCYRHYDYLVVLRGSYVSNNNYHNKHNCEINGMFGCLWKMCQNGKVHLNTIQRNNLKSNIDMLTFALVRKVAKVVLL